MPRQAQRERDGRLHSLKPHPATPATAIQSVQAQIVNADAQSIMIEFAVRGAKGLFLPDVVRQQRRDGLWRTTCFEVFLQPVGLTRYYELNFSPSFAWAAYGFDRYREAMAPIEPRLSPEIERSDQSEDSDYFFLSAEFDVGHYLVGPTMLGLSAVIEETDGTKSYWALAHPDGPPDFHDPACFVLTLPAAG